MARERSLDAVFEYKSRTLGTKMMAAANAGLTQCDFSVGAKIGKMHPAISRPLERPLAYRLMKYLADNGFDAQLNRSVDSSGESFSIKVNLI